MAWKILFGSDIGLLSVFTIAGVFLIALVMLSYYMKKMNNDK